MQYRTSRCNLERATAPGVRLAITANQMKPLSPAFLPRGNSRGRLSPVPFFFGWSNSLRDGWVRFLDEQKIDEGKAIEDKPVPRKTTYHVGF